MFKVENKLFEKLIEMKKPNQKHLKPSAESLLTPGELVQGLVLVDFPTV